ncbi:MAG TPA: hypothetical protein VNA20_13785 [Frankiaceae bacterium]|nr:hypothetical protein [Frankiaceae bacterium]
MLRALLDTVQRPPHVIHGPALTLSNPRDAAELAMHLAALRAEPDGGWAVVRGLSLEQADAFTRLKSYVAPYLSAPRTLLCAVHALPHELVGLAYVDAAPRGFEVMAQDAVFHGRSVFLMGDVYVRRAGRTERWKPMQATQLVDRVVERRRAVAAAEGPEPPRPERAEPAPRPDPGATLPALLAEAADDVERYAAGALAVRLRRWDLVRQAAEAGQGPADTIALARAHVAATPATRPDRVADNAVLDSLCQFDAYAALVALDAGKAFSAAFARYWVERTRAALRAVVSDPDVRGAVFRGSDESLAAALRTLDEEAAGEGAAAGCWPGIEDEVVEEFLARHPG